MRSSLITSATNRLLQILQIMPLKPKQEVEEKLEEPETYLNSPSRRRRPPHSNNGEVVQTEGSQTYRCTSLQTQQQHCPSWNIQVKPDRYSQRRAAP